MHDSLTKPKLSKDGSTIVTDEFYNTLISSLGAILSLIGVAFLVYRAQRSGNFWAVLGLSIYGFSLINMFTSSALHHGFNGSPQTNHRLRQFDYFSIFIMIAGTFTPFCLILIRNFMGWSALGLVWSVAICGIILKATYPHIPRWLLTSIYIGMGWLGILIANPVYQAIHLRGLSAFLIGGIFFTVGGVIYTLEKPNPIPGRFCFHEIWHCFVLAGAASHFYIMFSCLNVPFQP